MLKSSESDALQSISLKVDKLSKAEMAEMYCEDIKLLINIIDRLNNELEIHNQCLARRINWP